MFAKFFKPKWQHARANVRLDAIEQFNIANTEQRDILRQLVQKDPDTSIRQAVLIKFTDIALIKTIAINDASADVRATAHHHFEQLLAGQIGQGPSLAQRKNALAEQTDNTLLSYVVFHADEALAELALARLDDNVILGEIALQHPLSRLRIAAAERINETTVLQRIAKASKSKDKRLFQLSRAKLADIRTKIEQAETHTKHVLELCENMENLSKSEFSPLYEPKVKGLVLQWSHLTQAANDASTQRFEDAHKKCLSTLDEHKKERTKLDTQKALQSELNTNCLALKEQLNLAQNRDDIDIDTLNTLKEFLEQQQTHWQKTSLETTVTPADSKRFNAALSVLKQYQTAGQMLLTHQDTLNAYGKQTFKLPKDAPLIVKATQHCKQLISNIHWPSDFKQPKTLLDAQNTLTKLQTKQHEIKGWEKQQAGELKDILSQLETAIDDGVLKKAEQLFNQAQSLFSSLPKQDTARLQTKFSHLKACINELRDWRGFGNMQQKEALCLQMEALIKEDVSPRERADMVKELQTAWKASDSGAQNLSGALWQRFKQASDAAYEPCHAYFKQQGETRKNNLVQRQNICEQLEKFFQQTDWEQADWKAVEKIIDAAKTEWRQYTPVERKPGKEIHQRFDLILKKLKSKLKDEYRKNIEHKRSLIQRAEALLDHDNAAEAIERAIKLQSDWREIGITQHKQNNQAWKNFRSACDAIFAHRDEQRQQQQNDQEKTKKQAEEICQKVDALAMLADDVLPASRNDFKTTVAEFNGLDDLPKKVVSGIQRRFEKACQKYEQRLKTLPQRNRYKQFEIMLQHAGLCQQLEQLSIQAAPANETDIDAIKQHWQDGALTANNAKALTARWSQALDSLSSGKQVETNQDNDKALALLCIRMEILADLPSPEDAKALRMEYQLARLNESMSQREQDPTLDQAYALVTAWCQAGVVDAALFSSTKARFLNALKTIGI